MGTRREYLSEGSAEPTHAGGDPLSDEGGIHTVGSLLPSGESGDVEEFI